MEKLSFKTLLIFGLGVVIGSLATYKFTKDSLEKFYEEEMFAFREDVINRFAIPDEAVEELDGHHPANLANKDYTKVAKNYSTIANKQDIDVIMRERGLLNISPQDDDEEVEDEEYDEVEIVDMTPGEGIYVIPMLAFMEEGPNNEKLSLTYYARDNVLVDDKNVPIDDVVTVLGLNGLAAFNKPSEHPNTVYVRNHRLSVDFEVLKVEDSYRSAILGYEEEEEHKPVIPAKKNNLEPKKRRNKVMKDGEI